MVFESSGITIASLMVKIKTVDKYLVILDTGFLFLKACVLQLTEYANAEGKREAKKEKNACTF